MTQPDIPQELISRCQQRDRQAFRELVGLLMRPAYFQALALLGSAEDARDVSQEAMARLWTHLSRYDCSQPFYPWFYTVLRRLALNVMRTQQRRGEVGGEQADTWLETREDSGSTPDAELHKSRLGVVLTQALLRLSAADREIIVLKELQDYAYKDIAAFLGIPIGTVMSRLFAARARLRAALKEVGYENTDG